MKIKMLLVCMPLVFGMACGDDNSGQKDAGTQPTIDAPKAIDGQTVTIDASCFDLSTITSPTNKQIINACTDADKIYKDSHPMYELADGGLPAIGTVLGSGSN
jgi:hypothetical protein